MFKQTVSTLILVCSLGFAAEARADGPVFSGPAFNGVPITTCAKPGSQCGKAAADLFCKKNGYPTSSKFTVSRTRGQAIFIATGLPCMGQCERFSKITCGLNVNGSSSTDIGDVN
ncbi:MAG: hypothetical protein U1E15_11320 [Hyphomicrobiales bacterium]